MNWFRLVIFNEILTWQLRYGQHRRNLSLHLFQLRQSAPHRLQGAANCEIRFNVIALHIALRTKHKWKSHLRRPEILSHRTLCHVLWSRGLSSGCAASLPPESIVLFVPCLRLFRWGMTMEWRKSLVDNFLFVCQMLTGMTAYVKSSLLRYISSTRNQRAITIFFARMFVRENREKYRTKLADWWAKTWKAGIRLSNNPNSSG